MQSKTGYVIKTKPRGRQIVAKVKISSDFVINTRQSELLKKECPHGFFELHEIKRNRLEFSAPIGISLAARLKTEVSEHDFFFWVEQIVDAVRRLQTVGLSPNNLILDSEHIYMNQTTRELFFVYLPLATTLKETNVISFLERVIYAARPENANSNHLPDFNYYLKHLGKFDPDAIEGYIGQICPDIVNVVRNGGQKIQNELRAPQMAACCIRDDDSTDLMPDDDKTDIMAQKATLSQDGRTFQPLIPSGPALDEDATGIMDDDATELFVEEDENTALLDEPANTVAGARPFLVRVVTQEVIRINKAVFRIGKETSCVDYAIFDNAAISRSHADIICRGGKFFVFDLRSKNKTYINNRVLPAEQEVEIFRGDTLKLANEEFLFQV